MSQHGGDEPAIEMQGVSYLFKKHQALEDVNFQVQPQSLHGFVGPNGAGKTTSLRLICTLLRPQQGQVKVFGHDVRSDAKAIRRRIGFMPDHFSMYRQMTVYEYLDFFGAAYGISAERRSQIIGDVLALTDMDGRKNDLINGLSRGMQQRVSLSRVLVNDPDLLLLDEPASGLDPRARIELMEILRELRSMGKTIFISSHILSELADLCDSVTIIDRGTTRYCGSMTDLLMHQSELPVYRLTLAREDAAFEQELQEVPGVTTVEKLDGESLFRVTCSGPEIDVNRLLRGVIDRGLPVAGIRSETRHLNDAFMDLTQAGVR